MFEPVSALSGVEYSGIAEVKEVGLVGMITLRGDLADAGLAKAVKAAVGQDIPAPLRAEVVDGKGVCWMSPDELLLLCDYAEVEAKLAELNAALAGSHYQAVNVSDARAVFQISGGSAREVLAKLSPADLSPEAFGPGTFRRSRLAQVAGAFWIDDAGAAHVICFRSVGQYVFDLLKVAAQPGSEVGVF